MESMDQDEGNSGDEMFMEVCDDGDVESEPAGEQIVEGASGSQSIGHETELGDRRESEQEYTMPVFENGRFRNPWKSLTRTKITNLFRFIFCSRDEGRVPKKAELDRTLPVLQPDLTEFSEAPVSGIRHMWIGHASSLVQFDGVTFLTDPIFSERCSPVQFVGIKRYRPTPCSVEELPLVDFVLISHSHYDHLDHNTVVALNQRFGISLRWYVPSGLKKWMNERGCDNVVEMTWWQENVFNENLNVKVACTPSQHWSRRTGSDENKVLWCSWCVVGPKHNFHFCGDTGYCEGHTQIGKRYGPFTLSTIPIGAYSPRHLMSNMHIDPANAVNVHHDIKSQASIGIHWGTFALTNEPYLEPKELLGTEVQNRNMKPSSFFTVKHGEILLVGSDHFDDVD
ncbi:N-acyl-phosphatidylethanolamine-hydrolyzing phospholipase D [Aplysia californica]|uniref:N-acetylphosphatidylethanolamine-hydrolyzing phospholipase D n=1 Tax=Aplysia californica TaxID=6500 RepID=A0ABM0JTT2_APLCA|nr:N-acyl-phosphatidylethanolamine-hydrolyzing phospholipase D [Aplysia californica]